MDEEDKNNLSCASLNAFHHDRKKEEDDDEEKEEEEEEEEEEEVEEEDEEEEEEKGDWFEVLCIIHANFLPLSLCLFPYFYLGRKLTFWCRAPLLPPSFPPPTFLCLCQATDFRKKEKGEEGRREKTSFDFGEKLGQNFSTKLEWRKGGSQKKTLGARAIKNVAPFMIKTEKIFLKKELEY